MHRPLSPPPDEPDAPLSGHGFTPLWTVFTPGVVAFQPLPLASGLVVVVSDDDGDAVHVYDDDGQLDMRLPLPSRALAAPARTGPWVCVVCDGLRFVLIDLRTPGLFAAVVRVPNTRVSGGLLGSAGRFFARLESLTDAPAVIAVLDTAEFRAPRFMADPFPGAAHTRWAATHEFVFCGATDPQGAPVVAAWDPLESRFMWTVTEAGSGLVALRAIGGRLDMLVSDRVITAFAYDLSGRRQLLTGLGFDSSALAGEHILVRFGDGPTGRAATFHLSSEEITGELDGVGKIIAADTNHALVELSGEGPAFVNLPDLEPVHVAEASSLADASKAAFGWHTVWVVHGGGGCLTAWSRPERD